MRWTVIYRDAARRQFLGLPEPLKAQVDQKVVLLQDNPFPPGCRKLNHPEHLYRLRVGHYRIVYQVDQSERIVRILRVRHRRDVYRDL